MKIGVGILGLGTVGSGVIEIIQKRAAIWKATLGLELNIVAACARSAETREVFNKQGYWTTESPSEVIQHPEVQVVLELVGGYDLPLAWIQEAFEHNKHVITANKALIAKYGADLFPQASAKNLYFMFEAAVAAGIPVIKSLQESFVGNEITALSGIINGTTNYILSEMSEKGSAYLDVLAEAQRLGYAEADPTFDVEGIDAAHKLAILASICSNSFVNFEKMHIEGVSKIGQEDVEFLKENGYSIKLLGCYQKTSEGLQARVHPCVLPRNHLLATVDGALNAVYMETDHFGPTLQTGAGAGKLETASGVVGDLICVARGLQSGAPQPVSMSYYDKANESIPVSIDTLETSYYLRFSVTDEAGVLSKITGALSDAEISVDSIHQPHVEDSSTASIVVFTHKAIESKIAEVLNKVQAEPYCLTPPQKIRFL